MSHCESPAHPVAQFAVDIDPGGYPAGSGVRTQGSVLGISNRLRAVKEGDLTPYEELRSDDLQHEDDIFSWIKGEETVVLVNGAAADEEPGNRSSFHGYCNAGTVLIRSPVFSGTYVTDFAA